MAIRVFSLSKLIEIIQPIIKLNVIQLYKANVRSTICKHGAVNTVKTLKTVLNDTQHGGYCVRTVLALKTVLLEDRVTSSREPPTRDEGQRPRDSEVNLSQRTYSTSMKNMQHLSY